jgi:hypothetical protein
MDDFKWNFSDNVLGGVIQAAVIAHVIIMLSRPL